MDAGERRALIKTLMAEEYVLIGGVHMSKAKAADFVTKTGGSNAAAGRLFRVDAALLHNYGLRQSVLVGS